MIHVGDCIEVMRGMEADTFHACVTDPPYHLTSIVKRFGSKGAAPAKSNGAFGVYKRASAGFMGQTWDGGDVALDPATWGAVARVLRPGAHLVAFGGTRTFHRLACAIEDAGFEIRDTLMWVYGSGLPKRHNQKGEWQGWGTALKPAWEPIILARKPLDGTVAANLAKWGCGAINVDECRVGTESTITIRGGTSGANGICDSDSRVFQHVNPPGRWPANLVHDGSDEVVGAFPAAAGQLARESSNSSGRENQNTYGAMKRGSGGREPRADIGSAARFFYCAKASRADRNDGAENKHPTVKPTELMRWLVRLVTPPGGHVIDPFMGSGSTGRGCVLEGMAFTGIDQDADYADIARRRIRALAEQSEGL